VRAAASRFDRGPTVERDCVDATAAWWLEHGGVPPAELSATLTEQVWLILESTAGGLGVTIDPDVSLPTLS
jgi:hypothetical protein